MAQMDAKDLSRGRMVINDFTNDQYNPYPLHQKQYQFDPLRSAVKSFNERHLSFRHCRLVEINENNKLFEILRLARETTQPSTSRQAAQNEYDHDHESARAGKRRAYTGGT